VEDEGITRCFLTRDHLAQDYLVVALAAIFCLRSRFLAASTRCSPSRLQACYPCCLRCRRRLSCSALVALALMVGTLIFVYLMLRSRRGLALGAIRDHETAAAGLGVDIYSTMLAVYVATAGRNRYGRRTHSSADGPHLPGRCLLGSLIAERYDLTLLPTRRRLVACRRNRNSQADAPCPRAGPDAAAHRDGAQTSDSRSLAGQTKVPIGKSPICRPGSLQPGKSGRIRGKLASAAERCHQFANVQSWAKMHVSRTESNP
jgi:Branched-chain amino acid transport system / permease component